MEKIYGIDVSHWQGTIDWSAVAKTGIDFVIVKAGGSDGKIEPFYKESTFERNYEGAKANGLNVGAYYYVGPNFLSAEDGIADANRFLDIIKVKTFEMPIALDLESTRIEDKTGATDAAIAFCETLENAGYYVVIYGSDLYGFKDRMEIDRLKDYDKWVARYGSEPQYVKEYGIWQYSSTEHIDGITENSVDKNIAYKDYPFIIKNAGLNGFSADSESSHEDETSVVPSESEEPEEPIDIVTYTIQPGDNLSVIAEKFDTTVDRLIELNGIENPNLIYAGDVLTIQPGSSVDSELTTYTIQPGDNLSVIAEKFGTTVDRLVELNGIENPNLIYAGDVLRIN